MAKQTVTPSTPWEENSSNPFADQSNQDGDRGGGGGQYIYTVTGIGTKSSTAYLQDFEDSTLGAVVTSPDGLSISNKAGSAIINTEVLTGTQSLEQDYSSEAFPKVYRVLSGTSPTAYMTQRVKMSGSNSSTTVFKFERIGANSTYSGNPKAGCSWTSSATLPANGNTGGEMWNGTTLVGTWANNHAAYEILAATVYKNDVWQFFECFFNAGTLDNSDGYFECRVDGKSLILWEDIPYLITGFNDLPEWFLTAMNGLDNGPNMQYYMDSLYVDESLIHVIMTDSATYSASTKFANQPIASVTSDLVTANKRREVFNVGDTCYLHTFDSTGASVDVSSSFTVTEDDV